ncbi:MAG TPA: hypothetical protein VHC69_19025 [Polyangiaceae bacterium]|nr:hypothetical protein [Polyangiaceae bacterium]
MVFVEFVFALVISMLCAALLLPVTARSGFRLRHPDIEPASIFVTLLILFLATWAGGVWLVPIGPRIWGVAWGSFVVVGLIIALVIVAVSTVDERPATFGEPSIRRARIVDLLLLLLLVLLVLAIVAGYAYNR